MARMGIGALARRTGCNIETIRYYERIGLLPPPPRSAGGHRIYDENHAGRLSFIRRGRALGFPLDHVAELLGLAEDDADICADVRTLAAARLGEVREKLRDLRRLEAALKEMIARCEDEGSPRCPILETLQEA